MSRRCTVCHSPNRHEIEIALVKRAASYRDIARRLGVSKDAVSRHVNEGHIAERVREAGVEEDVRAALDVTRQLKAINEAAIGILQDARRGADLNTALRAIDRIHRQLELQAKLLGELDERPVLNLNLSPEWLELRAVIVGALEPHPEARDAVLSALEGADNG